MNTKLHPRTLLLLLLAGCVPAEELTADDDGPAADGPSQDENFVPPEEGEALEDEGAAPEAGLSLTADSNPHAVASGRTVSVGRTWDLGKVSTSENVVSPAPADLGAIVGIGIASDDDIYTWYADGTVTRGNSQNLSAEAGPLSYVLPKGKTPSDIIAMDIAPSTNHVYTWYSDGTVSEGWSRNLGAYSSPKDFKSYLPAGKTVADIVGIGIASDNHVYTWYADGTVSEGWTQRLAHYQAPYPYITPSGKKIGHVIDMAIASNDLTYTWYHDVELGAGDAALADLVDARVMDVVRRYRVPGVTVAVSKGGKVVLEKGYGYADYSAAERMFPDSRSLIGSVSKLITALGVVRLDQERSDFEVSDPVYGSGGAIPNIGYVVAQEAGTDRYHPIVAKAIDLNNRVYTWYRNGKYTIGSTTDPDSVSGTQVYDYGPVSGTSLDDIRAIAFNPLGEVVVWYDDHTYSVGAPSQFDMLVTRDKDKKVDFPPDPRDPKRELAMTDVVGISIASTGRVYAWYDDGTVSAGTLEDFDAHQAPLSYEPAAEKSRYSIRTMSIAQSNNHIYTWYSDGTRSHGWSRDLDHYGGTAAYDVPATAYDPNRDWDAWYASMRVEHVLSHSAGFLGGGDISSTMAMYGKTEDQLTSANVHGNFLRTRKLMFAPGTSADYSNHGGGTVGALIIESVTDRGSSPAIPYANYIRDHVLAPVGLDDAILPHCHAVVTPRNAHRHVLSGGVPASYDDYPSSSCLGLPSGGWEASAGALVRLMLAIDGNPNHPDILDATHRTRMETRPKNTATTYALGWNKDDKGKLAKDGALDGGSAYVTKYPAGYTPINGGTTEEITIAVSANMNIGSSVLRALAQDIAIATDRVAIPANFDLH